MSRIAIISDIHGNLEALEAVLADIRAQEIDTIYCLGDLVGYGPDPSMVIEHAMTFQMTLLGNHDEAAVKGAIGFNPLAKGALDWTREKIKPGFFSSRKKKKRWEFLKGLPRKKEEGDVLFVHASPRDPTMEYILRADCDDLMGEIPVKIREILELVKWVCFCGHTHDPGIITQESEFLEPAEVGMSMILEKGRKWVVNVGSVGQPRDGDPRACYVTWDGSTVQYRRVEYNFYTTMEKIYNIEVLDRRIGDRLAVGR
jgi:diadenosine tetraphosphatase ApaH/serine/threonine PP2A family protein phosphatase